MAKDTDQWKPQNMLIITGQKGTEQTSLVRKRKCLRVGSLAYRLTNWEERFWTFRK